MEYEIIDYNKKYRKGLNALDKKLWGAEWYLDIKKILKPNMICKIAVDENKNVIAYSYGAIVGDSFHLDVIAVDSAWQYKGIGTQIFDKFLKFCKEKNLKTFLIESVITVNGKQNSKRLIEKAGFEKLYTINGYFGGNSPDVFCHDCQSKPCRCSAAFYAKHFD